MYHNSGDLSDREGYDFDQLKGIAKVQVRFAFHLFTQCILSSGLQFATILHYAGFELHK